MSLNPPPPQSAPISSEANTFTRVWSGWFRSLFDLLNPGTNALITIPGGGSINVIQGIVVQVTPAAIGLSTTIALAKLTTGGTNGSITVVNGIITTYVAPT